MRTSESIRSFARRLRLVTRLVVAAVAITGAVTMPADGGTSSPPPVTQCSDFACEK